MLEKLHCQKLGLSKKFEKNLEKNFFFEKKIFVFQKKNTPLKKFLIAKTDREKSSKKLSHREMGPNALESQLKGELQFVFYILWV